MSLMSVVGSRPKACAHARLRSEIDTEEIRNKLRVSPLASASATRLSRLDPSVIHRQTERSMKDE